MSMKLSFSMLLFSVILISCDRGKSIDCNTHHDGTVLCVDKHQPDISICIDSLELYMKIKLSKYGTIVYHFDETFTTIKTIEILPEHREYMKNKDVLHVNLNSRGEIDSAAMFNSEIYELITIKHRQFFDFYEIGYFFPKPVNFLPLYNFCVDSEKKDTFDFFYYTRKDDFVHLVTDNAHFINNDHLDSTHMELVKGNIRNTKYFIPVDSTSVIPILNNQESILVKNTLHIELDQKSYWIGEIWGFYNSSSQYPYSQKVLYFNGSILDRIKIMNNVIDFYKPFLVSNLTNSLSIAELMKKNKMFNVKGKHFSFAQEIKEKKDEFFR